MATQQRATKGVLESTGVEVIFVPILYWVFKRPEAIVAKRTDA